MRIDGSTHTPALEEISPEVVGASLGCYVLGSVVLAVIGGVVTYGVCRVLFLIFKRTVQR